VYAQPADGTRRANSAMLIAQHKDATNVMSTASGEAKPAYDTTRTRAVMTEAAAGVIHRSDTCLTATEQQSHSKSQRGQTPCHSQPRRATV
jgi:hypothetical protein